MNNMNNMQTHRLDSGRARVAHLPHCASPALAIFPSLQTPTFLHLGASDGKAPPPVFSAVPQGTRSTSA